MRSPIISLLCLMLSQCLLAQEYKLTLSEAIAIGLENKTALKNQRVQVKLAENELDRTRTKNLPQITASFDARVNTQLQTQVISPEATGGNPASDPIRAQFGTRYYNVFAINASQNLYNPDIRYDRKINEHRTVLEQLNLEKSEIDTRLIISEAYLDAAYKKVKWETSQFNYQVAQKKLLRGLTQFKLGTKLKIDLDKDKLDERNALQTSRNDSSLYQLSLRYLANELNLPPTASVQVVLTEEEIATDGAAADTTTNRIEVQMERQQLLIHELNSARQKAAYFPVVSLYANYTVQQFNDTFDPADGKFWTPYNYLGLRIEIPIFDGLLKSKTKKEYTYRIEQSSNKLAQLDQQINYEIQSAQWDFENARNNYVLSLDNYEVSKQIVKTDLVRLEAGSILPVDAKDSEYAMHTAQQNYLNSLYQFMLARLRLQKATGALK